MGYSYEYYFDSHGTTKSSKAMRAMKYGLIPEVVFLKVSLITTTAQVNMLVP